MNTVKHYERELNPLGAWPNPWALDKTAVWTPNVDGEEVFPGQVVSLRSDGTPGELAQSQLGLACAAMPLFAFRGSEDQDALMTRGSLVGPGNDGQAYAAGSANFVSLVATGGYEVESTEFAVEDAAGLVPNAFVTAGLPGAADAGVLRLGTRYVDTICLVVSDGVLENEYGNTVVRGWTYFLPPVAACEGESS